MDEMRATSESQSREELSLEGMRVLRRGEDPELARILAELESKRQALCEKALQTLEFGEVLHRLAGCCLMEEAAEAAMALRPSTSEEAVRRLTEETTCAKGMLNQKSQPPFLSVGNIPLLCDRALKGAMLTIPQLLSVERLLRMTRELSAYFDGASVSVLEPYVKQLQPQRSLEITLAGTFVSEEALADSASPELADIRRRLQRANSKVRDILSEFIRRPERQKLLQEPIVTMRAERYVIPVKVECKNAVPGIVHDTSASGQTLFIEPMAVVSANNEIRELQAAEQAEIERILYHLSSLVADARQPISESYHACTSLCLIFAKAELSFRMKAEEAELATDGKMVLKRARHPLIDSQKVVPIDVSLGGETRLLVITGPNTGGKTVTLKTLGLLSAMAQCGLHIPADYGSRIAVFGSILTDIGDEQSIQQSLSTFSAHMTNIASIVGVLDDRALVLLDEVGSGTDPVEGAALANALLEHIKACGATCAATTHYAELKVYALRTPGVQNASCEFDVETLRPTYRLMVGIPGRSNAFAISERIGIPAGIVRRAKELLDGESRHFEEVIQRLQSEQASLEERRKETEQRLTEARYASENAEKARKRLEENYQKEIEQAQKEARKIIERARAAAQQVTDELEALKKQRDKAELGQALNRTRGAVNQQLKQAETALATAKKKEASSTALPDMPLQKGDRVTLAMTGGRAEVLETPDKNGRLSVLAGNVTLKVRLADLRGPVERGAEAKPKEKMSSARLIRTTANVPLELDVRGLTGDEAIAEVDKYIDNAVLAHLNTVTVIHGKGTGVLRQVLQTFLKNDPRVATLRNGKYGEGDFGVTVCELK